MTLSTRSFPASIILAALAAFPAFAYADQSTSWIEIHAGKAFSFRAPPGTRLAPLPGLAVDSFVEEYQGQGFTLGFDYGLYSNRIDDLTSDRRYSVETIKVGGRSALMVSGPAGVAGETPWGCKGYLAAIYVVDRMKRFGLFRQQPIALEMHACTSDRDKLSMLRDVLRSVRFDAR